MWFIGVEVEQETSAPPPKKILYLPLISIFNLYGYVVLLFFFNSFFICMAILEVKLVDQPLALLAWEELVVLWQNEQTALEWKFFITTETGVKQMRKNLVRYFVPVQDVDPLLSTSPSVVQSATL